MFSKGFVECKKIRSQILEADILESGNISEINKGIFRLNQLTGNNLEPTALNIYLRVENESVEFTRMIGVGSPSKFEIVDNKVVYKGTFKEINYSVVFTIVENAFYFDVKVNNTNPSNKVTVFYGMDVAVGNKYAVKNNESYVCQYVDHQAFLGENGYVIASRQNQGEHTYLEQGSIGKNVAYCTDGYQFFGTSYKLTNTPKALVEGKLPSQVYQYEFGYVGLQSETFGVGENHICFYGVYHDEMSNVVCEPQFTETAHKLYSTLDLSSDVEVNNSLELKVNFNNVYASRALTEEELNKYFPERKHEEYVNGKLESFFMNDYSHVVLQSKEEIMERPSGQVLISGNHFDFEEVLASTSYIYGLFTSQIVLGNTSFNKLSSNSRNSLNVQKITGQRIFVKLNGEYKLLTMPAVFQMGLNYVKWLYVIEDDVLVVETIINEKTSKLTTNVKSTLGKSYEFLLSNYLTMAQNEHEAPVLANINGNTITLKHADSWMTHGAYPDLYFTITTNKECTYSNDSVFYNDGLSHGDTILTTELTADSFSVVVCGSTWGNAVDNTADQLEETKAKYNEQFKDLLNGFELKVEGEEAENIDAFNYLAYWYTQNALVHFTSPHGLEQYNGAAWGTRDVCQGPAEYFLATQHFDRVKEIILEVFKHQYIQNGNWPQWFMFDKYFRIQQHESHGDIIVWPMRLLGLYLESTKDFSILEEKIPYTDITNSEYTAETYTVLDHLENEIANIVKSFIEGTSLSCYGGGDWDDTLQPANKQYADHMVSGWTVALTYEGLTILSRELKDVNPSLATKYASLCETIKADYNKYIMEDNIPAGFIHFTDHGIDKIIHPTDNRTNMKYRLLPFNRGIISELFTVEQKDIAIESINKHLKHPDGVRLMDKTVPYHGGNNTYFTRAETASNFGREIGLQYCHAHIRYCEAMAKVGNADDLYKGLLTIHPVAIHNQVKNALPRQRNSYFSSSDGNFLTRYDAMENFGKLFTGEVGVKAGWRIYSSGPGIYLNQTISNMLGLRLNGENFILDPVLPNCLDNLQFTYKIDKKCVIIKYKNTGEEKVIINNVNVPFTKETKAYRNGGYVISKEHLQENNIIEVHF